MLEMSSKEIRINVRTTEEIKRNLEITASLRGMTVSSLINSLAVKVVREEMEFKPEAFKGERLANEKKKAAETPPEFRDGSPLAPYAESKMLMKKPVRAGAKKKTG